MNEEEKQKLIQDALRNDAAGRKALMGVFRKCEECGNTMGHETWWNRGRYQRIIRLVMCYDKNTHVYDTGRHMWGSKLRGHISCKVCGVIAMIDEVGRIKPYECELDRPEGWWGPLTCKSMQVRKALMTVMLT